MLLYLFFPYSLFIFFSSSDNSLYLFFALSVLIILCYFHDDPLPCLKSLLCFFDNKLFHSFFIYDEKKLYKAPFLSLKLELAIMVIVSFLLIYQKWNQ